MRAIGRLRRVAVLEAATLLMLLLVAVPLKHLAHVPTAVAVMGPIHGLMFIAYGWTVIETSSAEDWSGGETARLLLVALVPFGGFITAVSLGRKATAARSSAQ